MFSAEEIYFPEQLVYAYFRVLAGSVNRERNLRADSYSERGAYSGFWVENGRCTGRKMASKRMAVCAGICLFREEWYFQDETFLTSGHRFPCAAWICAAGAKLSSSCVLGGCAWFWGGVFSFWHPCRGQCLPVFTVGPYASTGILPEFFGQYLPDAGKDSRCRAESVPGRYHIRKQPAAHRFGVSLQTVLRQWPGL